MKKITNLFFTFFNSDIYQRILSHSKNYFISAVAVKAIAVISMPIMTRILSPEDYGVYNVYLSYINIFVPLLSLNLYSALGRYYYEENADLKTFFGTSIISVLTLLCFWGVIFIVFSDEVASLINVPVSTVNFIVPSVFFYIVSSWFEQIYVAKKMSKLISSRDIVRAMMMLLVGVVFVLYLDKDKYLGMVYSVFIVGSVFLIYYVINLKQYISWNFNQNHFKYMFNFSVPLIPSYLSGIILSQFDRIMINKMIGPSETGLYSIAYNVALLLTLVITSLSLAWMPDYYDLMAKENYKKMDKDIDRIFRIIFFGALGLICFSKELIYILAAPKFHSAYVIVPIIIVGYIFNAFYSFYSWVIIYAKRNLYLTIITLIGSGSNILLNYLLLPTYGYMVAAYTTTFSFALMSFCAWLFSKYILKIYSFSMGILLKHMGTFSVFVLAFYALTGLIENIFVLFFAKLILVITYLIFQIISLRNTKEVIESN